MASAGLKGFSSDSPKNSAEGNSEDNDHVDGSAYKAKSPVSRLTQTDALGRGMVLHLLEERGPHFGKGFVGSLFEFKDIAITSMPRSLAGSGNTV